MRVNLINNHQGRTIIEVNFWRALYEPSIDVRTTYKGVFMGVKELDKKHRLALAEFIDK